MVGYENRQQLETQLKEMIVERLFLAQKGVKPEGIPSDANLIKTLEIDSVSMLEITVGIEENYGPIFEGVGKDGKERRFKIEIFESVGSIASYVILELGMPYTPKTE